MSSIGGPGGIGGPKGPTGPDGPDGPDAVAEAPTTGEARGLDATMAQLRAGQLTRA